MSDDVKPASDSEPPISTPSSILNPNTALDDSLRFFSRSPHPYHRRKPDLPCRKTPSSCSASSSQSPCSNATPTQSDVEGNGFIRKRDESAGQRASATPSESGTEADDEGYGVKALPAPPTRPRKGLREPRASGIGGGLSPLLTPTQLEEEGRKLSQNILSFRATGSGSPPPIDHETRAAREKLLRRQRAEHLRRSSETALLLVITALIVGRSAAWPFVSTWHRVELLSHACLIALLLVLYPLRLVMYMRRRSQTDQHSRGLRIPAAYDPAPLLYPTALPVLISLSLLPRCEENILPNLVLSLSTLPSSLVPLSTAGSGLGFDASHWLVSLVPLIASENTDWPSKITASKPYRLKLPEARSLQPEQVALLFPLHQALVPLLHHLSTTSLLAAELQLLSVASINLLLFAASPAMVVLKALLWIGGLGLLVLCGRVLRWSVALARIPKWRFRRAGRIGRARQSLLGALTQRLGLKRQELRFGRRRDCSDSDADEDFFSSKDYSRSGGFLRLRIPSDLDTGAVADHDRGIRSAIERSCADALSAGDESQQPELKSQRRRNTLPNVNGSVSHVRRPSSPRAKRARSPLVRFFLTLTAGQAARRKWLYAGYVYAVVALLVLVPLRMFISTAALGGCEPFGWAIGYLLGNIQPLRFWIVQHDLDGWIPLPPLRSSEERLRSRSLGRAEWARQDLLGEANTRLAISAYFVIILALGISTVQRLTAIVEVDTRRKVFHGMMVAMLLPTVHVDPAFIALALGLVLVVFLVLDLVRVSQLPPLSGPIARFLTPYVDGRDLRGPVVISHIFLLIGCAIPLWLALASVPRTGDAPWGGWEVLSRDTSMIAGVVCVGMGDAAASLIGRRYGRRKWPWVGGKSLEGSLAFAVAVAIGLASAKAWLGAGGWEDGGAADSFAVTLGKAAVSACGASLMEAVLTGGNDNVIVPVILWLLVRAVGI